MSASILFAELLLKNNVLVFVFILFFNCCDRYYRDLKINPIYVRFIIMYEIVKQHMIINCYDKFSFYYVVTLLFIC